MDTDLASQILQRENQEKQALALLLDRYLSKSDRLLVQKTQMGTSEAYLGSVTLEWLASRICFASQLPLFQQKFDPKTHNIIRDSQTIEQLQQRPLDWSRQAHLAQYLATRKHHKFPPILAVISPHWVNDPNTPQWENDRAQTSAVNFTPLDPQGNLGLLDISDNYSIFALDGQHRLMGIQGLMELIKTGRLELYNKTKKAIGTEITTEDLIETYDLSLTHLHNLAKEKIGVEFIPAVLTGETHEEARRRVRSIFVHVNRMAVILSKGQLALLNEDDGFAIVARQLAITHPLLKDREQDDWQARVNWDSATISSKSTVLTTLQALQDMSEGYLSHQYPHWQPKNKKQIIPLRPEDEELEEALDLFSQLFNYLGNLPSYRQLENGTKTYQIRRFSHEVGKGQGNLLFRPVGQIALAQALGILVFKNQISLDSLFQKLNTFDETGGFSGLEKPSSLWYGILYDIQKKRILIAGRKLAVKLITYLLGGIEAEKEINQLHQEIIQARTIENKTIGFNGEWTTPNNIKLPKTL
ncbi:DGQHR domain protein [Gloeothece citriformis PCC 7424]|uniref:DGQHR domain protein n=1 Tax=Gloeothece citriformis (strain PCC 7424) TaxID=65393 RepID=B7KD72_GLOC7|nr:DGQHR domain-containing protein [Gloeothece citriformis]ACK73193.1 DGQHR domain protein [Gloeothece citriformis PCC 7424]